MITCFLIVSASVFHLFNARVFISVVIVLAAC